MGEGELNEISVAIGELRAEVRANREANRDALARVESRLSDISKQLTAKHEALDAEISKLKVETAKQATIISAVVAGIMLFGKQIVLMFGGRV